MFGKHFAQMYTGSMYGKPAIFFAVWGYIIAHQRPICRNGEHIIELNPCLLASTFSSQIQEVVEVLKQMCQPDPASRSKDFEGRKLIPKFDGEFVVGPMTFEVVNGKKYRAIRDEEERRIYLAEKQAEFRAKKHLSTMSTNVNRRQPPSTAVNPRQKTEAEAEVRLSPSISTSYKTVDSPECPKTASPKATPCEAKKRWEKPTLEQVALQAVKIGLPKDEAEKFFNFYESNGWRVGKNPMKSWIHALTNWSVNFRQRSFVASPYFKPDQKPERPLPTIADLKAQRLQDDQKHLPGTIYPSRDSNAPKGHLGGNAGHS